MGAYLAVQQGSRFPPQFIHLSYKPAASAAGQPVSKIVLVGKGLTFDSGGYNLKVRIGTVLASFFVCYILPNVHYWTCAVIKPDFSSLGFTCADGSWEYD